MADLLSLLMLALLFPTALLYVAGCDRLKGGPR